MNNIQAIKLSNDLMNKADVVYLSTVTSNNAPETRALLNLRNVNQYPDLVNMFDENESSLVTYVTTNTSSSKMKSIMENPKICLYYCKADEQRGLMLTGEAEIVTDMEIKKVLWHDMWKIFFPGGVTDPDYTIIRLSAVTAKGYDKIQTYNLEFKGK
ncbi:pyridoxamine 5'-phosphate oxidase family protein [Clostridium estertheticum]|uniref:General stress protein FMN-binding split barrel domain-containing protein n=1 Tax=Clostridium estertheticum subsp. estertheticum TaxID=1552 RepID=A0A1J0GK99_9CLOT|nr:pyridoxamine 5'-phosphate oxidase family protein [Clostridium estertheticum]APC41360.1 hypothetical protein A7L45_15375 [Clostridium estertheticum subsp. estertheticum]MBU3172748.1 pyridoxamine 5'-phosphate oxidase family protein [Clostridium estertheticum]MBZ9616755.1 pyridoxamine 5'-phosphate oxidase family protein [Clostridium estertheticum subsp. laramiense]WAG72463.1 pyridoxamine 5'-phosphate oxidase family protein [Clostridium estertheticum]